jgi:hypothetical protein
MTRHGCLIASISSLASMGSSFSPYLLQMRERTKKMPIRSCMPECLPESKNGGRNNGSS